MSYCGFCDAEKIFGRNKDPAISFNRAVKSVNAIENLTAAFTGGHEDKTQSSPCFKGKQLKSEISCKHHETVPSSAAVAFSTQCARTLCT